MPLAACGRAVGVLGGEVDALEAARQHQPQLVLGGDGGGLHAGFRHGGQDGAAAHERAVGDHALLAGGAVEVVVAGDAVHGRRHAGDDRGVVGVGEARHDGIGDGVEAVAPERGDGRQNAVGDAAVDVGGVAAVVADDDGGPLRRAVAAAVHFTSAMGAPEHEREMVSGAVVSRPYIQLVPSHAISARAVTDLTASPHRNSTLPLSRS